MNTNNPEQLIKLEKMAGLGALAAGIAHEINAPMSALKSNSDLFVRYFEKLRSILFAPDMPAEVTENSQLKSIFENIEKLNNVNKTAADRMASIIDTLRQFTRKDPPDMQRCDLHESLDRALTLIHHMVKERITIIKQYGELPEIDCFPNHIISVFLNILVNALQAIEGNGELTITTGTEGGYVSIAIADNGSGIAPEIKKKIFKPGFTTKSTAAGTGLGLAITKQIIDKHNGRISVDSILGVGTTFTIKLPISKQERTQS
ncbi:GHKL domain-containing protein [candidate division KSB1 bacterium]|nr:GHKL domain-containing protein [candidate division KSB1 bacterium]